MPSSLKICFTVNRSNESFMYSIYQIDNQLSIFFIYFCGIIPLTFFSRLIQNFYVSSFEYIHETFAYQMFFIKFCCLLYFFNNLLAFSCYNDSCCIFFFIKKCWTTFTLSSAYHHRSGFMLAVSLDTLPGIYTSPEY